ncbi:MAG: DUF1700 domain-containing protein [Spirochaetaceae bacterium]|nr:MAG: DUF1700 domain-containing protein [Spirochaetaceae bacterium]
MNKEQFLIQLKHSLSGVPEEEKKEILYDYEEHFRSAIEEGQEEEQITRSLGNPRVLGKSYRIESLLDKDRGGNRAANVLRAVFASLSLGFLNVIVTIPLFAGLLGGLASLWSGAVSLALSGVAVILAVIVQPLLPAFITLGGLSILFLVFAGIGISALGLLSVIGMWKLSQLFFRMTAKYVQFNVRIIKKQEVRT